MRDYESGVVADYFQVTPSKEIFHCTATSIAAVLKNEAIVKELFINEQGVDFETQLTQSTATEISSKVGSGRMFACQLVPSKELRDQMQIDLMFQYALQGRVDDLSSLLLKNK